MLVMNKATLGPEHAGHAQVTLGPGRHQSPFADLGSTEPNLVGKSVSDFWATYTLGIFQYDMSRTQSIMRVATTASPVSGMEVRERMLSIRQETWRVRATTRIQRHWRALKLLRALRLKLHERHRDSDVNTSPLASDLEGRLEGLRRSFDDSHPRAIAYASGLYSKMTEEKRLGLQETRSKFESQLKALQHLVDGFSQSECLLSAPSNLDAARSSVEQERDRLRNQLADAEKPFIDWLDQHPPHSEVDQTFAGSVDYESFMFNHVASSPSIIRLYEACLGDEWTNVQLNADSFRNVHEKAIASSKANLEAERARANQEHVAAADKAAKETAAMAAAEAARLAAEAAMALAMAALRDEVAELEAAMQAAAAHKDFASAAQVRMWEQGL